MYIHLCTDMGGYNADTCLHEYCILKFHLHLGFYKIHAHTFAFTSAVDHIRIRIYTCHILFTGSVFT